jgi:hypothetical protein
MVNKTAIPVGIRTFFDIDEGAHLRVEKAEHLVFVKGLGS